MESVNLVKIFLLLLLVFSLHMDDAFGAQNGIRKLKETRINKEGGDLRSSKTWARPSRTIRCGGMMEAFENMATTSCPGQGPFPGGEYVPSLCQPCTSYSNCYAFTCTYTVSCQSINGSPQTCTRSENCQPASRS